MDLLHIGVCLERVKNNGTKPKTEETSAHNNNNGDNDDDDGD